MTNLDLQIFVERVSAIERHLNRVKEKLPQKEADFIPNTDVSDAVILHLWQAVQLIIDLAISSCLHFRLGSPQTYAEAFLKLAENGLIEKNLSFRLIQAAGFRNRIVHAYEQLDMKKIYKTAIEGPEDLHAFLKAIRQLLIK